MIEPPSKGAIDSAVKRLKDVGALEQVFIQIGFKFF
jgi:hypothetical protein